jgi:hypothetical protein
MSGPQSLPALPNAEGERPPIAGLHGFHNCFVDPGKSFVTMSAELLRQLVPTRPRGDRESHADWATAWGQTFLGLFFFP